jgi:ATPase subunit of ABC transporter with duplicated ATPase domains
MDLGQCTGRGLAMRRPKSTLVDLLARDIARDPGDAPVVDVQDAVLAQDMGWVEERLRVDDSPEQRRQQAERDDRQHAEQADERHDHDHGVASGATWVPAGLRSHGAECGDGRS